MKFAPLLSKRIGLIATGNEVLQGDISDGNSELFAKAITDLGGDLYQVIKTSDSKSEMIKALDYLFQSVDVVITTGGLGPTSDDVTRFAVAEYFGLALEMSDRAWAHIEKRLHRFQLKINESNRQQALFPNTATLIENHQGSAWGAFIPSLQNQKMVVMLPGPPKECHPMFEAVVLPWLKSHDFLGKKSICRWMTLGLIESQIAPDIDQIAKPFDCETGYRWHYPYLEIKVTVPQNENRVDLLKKNISDKLNTYLIAQDALTAEMHLENTLKKIHLLSKPLHVIDELLQGIFASQWQMPNLIWSDIHVESEMNFLSNASPVAEIPLREDYVHVFSKRMSDQEEYSGQIEIQSDIKIGTHRLSHVLRIPYRPEISVFARAYLAWRIWLAIQLSAGED